MNSISSLTSFIFNIIIFLFLLSQQTSTIRYTLSQPNKRPCLQLPYVCSDHDEYHRYHILLGDFGTSSSARPVFNFNIPEEESFIRNFNKFMDHVSRKKIPKI